METVQYDNSYFENNNCSFLNNGNRLQNSIRFFSKKLYHLYLIIALRGCEVSTKTSNYYQFQIKICLHNLNSGFFRIYC